MTEKQEKSLIQYWRDNIEDYEEQVSHAWNVIAFYRCPLSYADPSLFDHMQNLAEEWAEENEIDIDTIDIDEIF